MTEYLWDRILRLRIILRQILTNPEVSGISIAERVEAVGRHLQPSSQTQVPLS